MEKIYKLKKKYKFHLIEDLVTLGEIKIQVGSCKYSDISTFAFILLAITTGEVL